MKKYKHKNYILKLKKYLHILDSRLRGNDNKGQALITLLFFTIMGVTVTTAAVAMIVVNSIDGMKLQQSTLAYQVAESGGENAILRLLRNPNYTGEILTVGGGTATITVTGGNGNPYIIISKGQVGNFIRTIQITANYVNNLFTVTAQTEIFP